LTGLLRDDGDEDILNGFNRYFDRMAAQANSAMEGASRVKEIVSNLKSFSRQDCGELQKSKLGAGLKSTLKLVKANYKDKVDFVCDIQDDPELRCSAPELNQVFMNLMINACQAMVVGAEEFNQLQIIMRQQGNNLLISFDDNGVGMSGKVKSHIFEPFFTTKPEGDGTGLGLSISFGIVERHGGHFELTSEEGRGTTMVLYLPLTLKNSGIDESVSG